MLIFEAFLALAMDFEGWLFSFVLRVLFAGKCCKYYVNMKYINSVKREGLCSRLSVLCV